MSRNKGVAWQWAVTSVPGGRSGLLRRTINSLRQGGFDLDKSSYIPNDPYHAKPLFVDAGDDAYANWLTTLLRLYLGNPRATYYAIFQDDFVTYRNLRRYLECCRYDQHTYWNLYSFPENEAIAPTDEEGNRVVGWHQSNQMGRGAVALVFSRDTVVDLLCEKEMYQHVQGGRHRAKRGIDGAVCRALKRAGYKEMTHWPSLVQHTGQEVSVLNTKRRHPLSNTFLGEDFDALELHDKAPALLCHS